MSADEEIVDGVPVDGDAECGGLQRAEAPDPSVPAEGSRPGRLVPVQSVQTAAALAATGFVAGAATVAVVAHRRARSGGIRRRSKRKNGALGEIVGSNSFLVDVHLIRRD